MLHVLDGSALHELRLVFGGLLQAARVHVAVGHKLVRAHHHRGMVAAHSPWAKRTGHNVISLTVPTSPSAVFPQSCAGGRRDGGDAVRLGVPVSAAACHHQRQNAQHCGGIHRLHRPAREEQQ